MPEPASRSCERVCARSRWLTLLGVALLGAIGVGATLWPAPRDEWVTLIEAGDALAAGGSVPPGPAGLTPRSAYLLAFHHAQDARDVPRMLAAADRLERLGEHSLAAHVRHVADTVAGAATIGEPRGGATSR